MESKRERTTLINVILIAASLLIAGLIIADPAFAEPKKTTSSMASRVTAQRDLCETLGGGEMDYVNSYENGKLVGVTTYCKGGTNDGWNCANTATTYDCWQGPKSREVQPPVLQQDRPELADPISDVQVVMATSTTAPPFNVEPVDASVDAGSPITSADSVSPGALILVELAPLTPASAP